MAYRCASLIPLLFSLIILIQGLFQIGVYAYFHQLAYSPSTPFFSSTYSPLWAGGWNFVAGLSLIFVLSTGNEKQWRQIRSIAVALFVSVLIIQAICWILCELLEFRSRFTLKATDSGDTYRRFAGAYISATTASVIGVTIGTCGLFYAYVIFYRLSDILFGDLEPNAVIRNSWNERRKKNSTKVAGSAPPGLAQHRVSQTADSWHFVRFRSSTPKASEIARRHRFRRSKKRNSDTDKSRNGPSPFEITDDDFNLSIPLRAITAIRPDEFWINRVDSDDLQSPSLVECFEADPKRNNNNCDLATSGKSMTSFFDDGQVRHLINAKKYQRPVIHWPIPPPPTPASCSANVVLPSNAWRLPSVSKPKVAKALNFSEEASNEIGNQGIPKNLPKRGELAIEISGPETSVVVNRL